jgi:hypothetical protein
LAHILLANEYGDGLGHLGHLKALIGPLLRAGHRVTLALGDPQRLAAQTRGLGVPVVPAPVATREEIVRLRGPAPRTPRGMAEVLAWHGLGDPVLTASLLGRWDLLLGDLNPDLAVCELAPLLRIACWGRLPTLRLGSGWSVPPVVDGSLPVLFPQRPDPFPETQLLAHAAAWLEAQRRTVPVDFGGLVAGEADVVVALPDLDPYHVYRQRPADGPLTRPPAARPLPRQPSWFAYLRAGAPGLPQLIAALATSGVRGVAYVRDLSPDRVAAWRARGLPLLSRATRFPDALEAASAVVHHGGLNTANDALALGRPVIAMPAGLESQLTARRLQGLGVGIEIREPAHPSALQAALHDALDLGPEIGRAHV